MDTSKIAALACIVAACPTKAQMNQHQAGDSSGLYSTRSCSTSQTDQVSCESVLSAPMGTKTSKSGDRLLLTTHFFPVGAEQPITRLEATVLEVQSKVNGVSILRIQIGKGIRSDGHQVSVQARIVGIISPSKVTKKWGFSPIVVDRFPVSSGGDQRQPGERTLDEDPHHVSAADSVSGSPVAYDVVCSDKAKTCTDLSDMRGSVGYRAVKIEAGGSPGESTLNSNSDISFPAGAFFVLELAGVNVSSR